MQPMQRMTANRQKIIEYIRDNSHEPPDAYGIAYDLGIAKCQVHRTLNDLVEAGILHVESQLRDPIAGQGLPRRVRLYEIAADAEANRLKRHINSIVARIHRAHHGVSFFGAIIDQGASTQQVAEMREELDDVRRLAPDDTRLTEAAVLLGGIRSLPKSDSLRADVTHD